VHSEEDEVQLLKGLADAFDVVGSRLHAGGPWPVLEALPHAAVELVQPARWASVTLLRHGKFSTVAATDQHAQAADAIQYELRSGPCVDAILEDTVFSTADLARDNRWPDYGQFVARQLGIRSMMSYRLGLAETEQSIAGLNLYADVPEAFDERDQWTGLLLATHGAVLITAATNAYRADHLAIALDTNRDIGAAIGILMANRHLTKDAAFNVLRIASQDTNRKLSDLAAEVIKTGELRLSARARGPRL
jgi:hypothetical protein